MIKVAHLLDDFAMGGVTRALTLFDEPALAARVHSKVTPVNSDARLAPCIKADLIVDHMALSWKRLVFLASLRARNPKARIVHVEHSYTASFERVHVTSKARFRAMLKFAASLVDEFICVSNAQKNWLAQVVGIKADKLSVIYPWTDRTELFDIDTARKHRGPKMRLLAYGRYAPVKNFDALIEAMRHVPPDVVDLTIFGDGPDGEKLEELSADLGNVRVLGPCDTPGTYLAECDAVIIPSKSEAFGLVATEARMAGRAIIVANVDGLPEQVGSGGFVATMGNAGEISQVIHDAAKRDLVQMGIQGRTEVRGQSEEIILRWIRLFERAADQLAGGAKTFGGREMIEAAS
ncbi:glycosyltransferase family 4 protein [Altererythrobacter ishigakiensis]|uniref:Glycosyltransferase involved in cell wall biosynthesis n=1 Tax=Altererythrobacter ishigakiensis TaxID=476157 RepID=A0A562ULP5_9SPHN|nr:glycosyltransferase family 4 protein [Altererythrobacter ishigakiensis]TWJ06537.1 glycosyltransferase involved in cell wall biosynthesis [Altererythrobacter ishigakiensis]